MEDPVNIGANRRADGTFGPGNVANPNGRPKGTSIKDRVRIWLEEHPDDMDAFVNHFVKENRDLAWQMMEGRPPQKLQGDPDSPLLFEVINYAKSNNPEGLHTEAVPTNPAGSSTAL